MSLIILVSCPHGRPQAHISFTFIYSSRAKKLGKIKSFLSDSQLGDVTLMFLKFLVFFSLKVLIKEVLIKKKIIIIIIKKSVCNLKRIKRK